MTRRTLIIAFAACASIAAVSAAGQTQDRAQAVRAFETPATRRSNMTRACRIR